MLLYVVVASLCAQAEPAQPIAASPAVILAKELVGALGPLHQELTLASDASIAADEEKAIAEALGAAFTLTQAAAVVVTLERAGESLRATARNKDGQALTVAIVGWPSPAPPPEPTPSGDDEAKYKNILAYRRERLSIQPIVRGMATPTVGLAWMMPWRDFRPGWTFDVGAMAPVPTSSEPNDWVVMRGPVEVLDERDLVAIAGDAALEKRIDEARFWPQLIWGAAFGAGAVAAVSTGAYFLDQHGRDNHSLGVSLVALGATSAVLALFFPAVAGGHELTPSEAESLVDDYNAELRQELGLRPREVEDN